MGNERSDKRNKALRDFRAAYFMDKECVGNHNDYINDLIYDIIKMVVQ